MRLRSIFALAAVPVMLAACDARSDRSGEGAENQSADATMTADNGAAGNATDAAATDPQQFVEAMAGSDLYEIESGRIAQEKASNAELKSFGEKLVTDHSKSSEQLKAAAARLQPAVTVPTALPPQHQAKIEALRGASGAEFDRLFVQQQTGAHQQALAMLDQQAASQSPPPLREFAQTARTAVKAHLDHLATMAGQ